MQVICEQEANIDIVLLFVIREIYLWYKHEPGQFVTVLNKIQAFMKNTDINSGNFFLHEETVNSCHKHLWSQAEGRCGL